MNKAKSHTTEVWAKLYLCQEDRDRIREFFMRKFGIKRRCIVNNMHITTYHARRPLPGLNSSSEAVSVIIPGTDFRFMVLAPGGENPRPELDPSMRKVGVRVHRRSTGRAEILRLREKIICFETPGILGARRPSNHARNAFGARNFQPHMTMLRPGSDIGRDLRIQGEAFRKEIGFLNFDRHTIEIVAKANTEKLITITE